MHTIHLKICNMQLYDKSILHTKRIIHLHCSDVYGGLTINNKL